MTVSRSTRSTPALPRAVPIAGRAPGAPWAIMQRVDHPDPAAANAEALHDLENGATGLALVFAGSVGAYGYGLDASEATIARVLGGRASRCRHRARSRSLAADQGRRRADRRTGQTSRHRTRRRPTSASASIRSAPRPSAGGSPLSWDALTPIFNAAIADLAAQGFRGPFAPRRRTRDPQCRRLGGAGAGLRARRRRHLSARAGSRTASRSMPRAA